MSERNVLKMSLNCRFFFINETRGAQRRIWVVRYEPSIDLKWDQGSVNPSERARPPKYFPAKGHVCFQTFPPPSARMHRGILGLNYETAKDVLTGGKERNKSKKKKNRWGCLGFDGEASVCKPTEPGSRAKQWKLNWRGTFLWRKRTDLLDKDTFLYLRRCSSSVQWLDWDTNPPKQTETTFRRQTNVAQIGFFLCHFCRL